MADTVLRIIGALFDYLLMRTGRWVLAIGGVKTNIFAELLVGIVTWITLGLSTLAIAAGVMAVLRAVHF
jgi:hypothetical protein